MHTINVPMCCTYITHMWPDLPKPTTYAHNGKERFSPPIDRSINKLTNSHNTTATSWLVCFSWGLFLRPVRRPRVLGCSLSVTGWLVQAATLLKITTWLVHDVGHGCSYILWHLELYFVTFGAIFCDILSAMGPHSRPLHLENYWASL